jgi:hypothetical protein
MVEFFDENMDDIFGKNDKVTTLLYGGILKNKKLNNI